MPRRITVVVSQGQSSNPVKRQMEEELVTELLLSPGFDVTVIPHLYDLSPDGTGMLCLQGIAGDLVLCSWLFPRAAFWILDRNGIRGKEGQSLIKPLGADDDEEEPENEEEPAEPTTTVDRGPLPNRTIYCLDLRTHASAAPYLEEIRRIASETATETVQLMGWLQGTPRPEQVAQYLRPQEPVITSPPLAPVPASTDTSLHPTVVTEETGRRWYPVIDYSRCTNCLECIDFCLFGVYGIDRIDTILVEQPDNCRKGCPACSRVCPENAIIFPQHKTPTIAGSPDVVGGIKIDLSLLFGAPDPGAPGAPDAMTIAAQERDEQLVMAGREAVGLSVPKRRAAQTPAPRDELDNLMDKLDEIDL